MRDSYFEVCTSNLLDLICIEVGKQNSFWSRKICKYNTWSKNSTLLMSKSLVIFAQRYMYNMPFGESSAEAKEHAWTLEKIHAASVLATAPSTKYGHKVHLSISLPKHQGISGMENERVYHSIEHPWCTFSLSVHLLVHVYDVFSSALLTATSWYVASAVTVVVPPPAACGCLESALHAFWLGPLACGPAGCLALGTRTRHTSVPRSTWAPQNMHSSKI